MVCGHGPWETEPCYPLLQEGTDTRLGLHIFQGHFFQPASRPSIMVSRYLKPSVEEGREPTRSTWIWLNLWSRTGMGTMRAAGCLVTLAVWQGWHSLHQLTISVAIPGHTTLAERNLLLALMLWWTREWKASKTDLLQSTGTTGRGELVETSYQRERSPTGTTWMSRLEVEKTASVTVQDCCSCLSFVIDAHRKERHQRHQGDRGHSGGSWGPGEHIYASHLASRPVIRENGQSVGHSVIDACDIPNITDKLRFVWELAALPSSPQVWRPA